MPFPEALKRRVPVPLAVAVVVAVAVSLVALHRTLAHRLEARQYHGQLGQDAWVFDEVFPGVKDGYFVDVGSGDGEHISNTWKLELNGWRGVCVDPFPTNMARRSCRVFREPVYSHAGEVVLFRRSGLLGGVEAHLSPDAPVGETVELTTVTLDDVLERAGAPAFIHYISIDVEGAELEVLQGLSLDQYRVGAFTIEHAYEEPKRSQIRELLEANGYRLARSVFWDDWYLPANR